MLSITQMVYQLYQGQDSESRSVADQWLQSLQNSEQAWSLSWTLLQHQVTHLPILLTVALLVENGLHWNICISS